MLYNIFTMQTDNIASYIKKYRESADMTQGILADKIGVSRQSIISLESGKCIPSVSLAIKLAKFFEVPVEFIFRYEDEDEGTIFDDIKEKINNGGGNMSRDLMPWSPWREMMSLRETIDRVFDEPMSQTKLSSSLFHPTIGIRENEKELVIEADLPGVKEEDITVEIEDDKLLIKGERKYSNETKQEDYYHMESSYGSFSRVIGLPAYVDSEKADAEVRDGILQIKMPKVEKRKAKKLPIKTIAKK